MSEKDRAKKLAAARKKLKAYQSNEKQSVTSGDFDNQKIAESTNLQSYFVQNVNETTFSKPDERNPFDQILHETVPPKENVQNNVDLLPHPQHTYHSTEEHEISPVSTFKTDQMDIIQVLMASKDQLSSQLSNCQTELKEKTFEIEEYNTRLTCASKRIEELETQFLNEQNKNKKFQKQIDAFEKEKKDQKALEEYLEELNKELAGERTKINELNKIIQEKDSALELNNIRINQISDETSITIDNRIESLTQTKFMYEQQIVDLQTMVQQLRTEKEQANQQYQNYVQHLTKDINALTEKKTELLEKNSKLTERERELINHVSGLEKQIQQNMAMSESLKNNQDNKITNEEMEKLKIEFQDKIDFLEKSKLEFEAIITRQKEDLIESQKSLQDKANKIVDLEERLEHVLAERPNDAKLLASIESDKIAASRAMAQNSQLRKQLDEVQLRLIEITNDKMDLTTTLDSERHINKEMRLTYDDLTNQVQSLNEKIFFKDEEMIRLIRENNQLKEHSHGLDHEHHHHDKDDEHHHHDEDHEHHHHDKDHEHHHHDKDDEHHHCDDHDDHHHDKDHDNHSHYHSHSYDDHAHENTEKHLHNHNDDHEHHSSNSDDKDKMKESSENSFVMIDHEKTSCDDNEHNNHNHAEHSGSKYVDHPNNKRKQNILPTNEAMQRLEKRFTTLMTEVADLTEEKQRLEHLVLQLQDETETIGEYIALYQTQRKMLRKKEIEKDAQLNRLSTEREEFRENLSRLTQLINKLGLNIEIGSINELNKYDHTANTDLTNANGSSSSSNIEQVKQNNSDSQEIVKEIYSLITEIKSKDNFPMTVESVVDHCACCSGKFETI